MSKTNKRLFALVVMLLLSSLMVTAAPDYDYDDTWSSQANEATSTDDVFFRGIDADASIVGSDDCECHSFNDDLSVIFSVNGELFQSMEVNEKQNDTANNIEIEVTDINTGSPDTVSFTIEGTSDTLNEGQTKTYTIDGDDYEVTVVDIDQPIFDECVCTDNTAKNNCVSDANSSHGPTDPLVRICGSGDQRCTVAGGDATIKAKIPKLLDDSFGYQYDDCGGSFSRVTSNFEEGAIIDMRRIQCGGTGQEDDIIYKGSMGIDGETNYGLTNHSCPANYWCDQIAANSNTISNAFSEFDIDPVAELDSNDICRKQPGIACNSSIECLTGAGCNSGFCGNSTIDITEIIPIQVIEDVSLIKGKSGFVIVKVENSGNVTVNVNVTVTFEGALLNSSSKSTGNPQMIVGNTTATYIFDFKPWIAGSNLEIEANATIVME